LRTFGGRRPPTNTYQLFCYDFPKFLAKGVLSTTTIFEKYQTIDF
jgi:hypothetical protein